MLSVGGRGSLAAVGARAAGGGWWPTGVSVQLTVLGHSRVGGRELQAQLGTTGSKAERPGCLYETASI